MSAERLREQLDERAPGQWELYQKMGRSREWTSSPGFRSEVARQEEGWAARWFESDTLRFASAASAAELERAIPGVVRMAQAPSRSIDWPTGQRDEAALGDSLEAPPDLFEELARLLAAESRGEASLTQFSIRRGMTRERIENARGLRVELTARRLDGNAAAIGRRAAHASEARVLFRWDADTGDTGIAALARRLGDAATLPLSMRSTPVARGEWLLEPAVAASILAAIAPVFTAHRPPPWIHRGRLCAEIVTIADDATGDAPFDGEGTATRRITLVDNGNTRGRLTDLETSAETGLPSTGHGVRSSYRTPPGAAPRRLILESQAASPPIELLSSVRRGLFASALTAPVHVDLEADHYEVEFTGVSIVAGRAQGPVAGARARGRISRLLQEIVGVATDRQYLPAPYPVGTPTLLVGHAQFD